MYIGTAVALFMYKPELEEWYEHMRIYAVENHIDTWEQNQIDNTEEIHENDDHDHDEEIDHMDEIDKEASDNF